MNLKTLAVLGTLGVATAAHGTDSVPVESLADTIAAQWSSEFNGGDATRLSRLYADDAVLMPPSDETLISREAIEAYWTRALNGLSDYDVEIVQSRAQGDMLYAAGIWSANKTLAEGERVVVGGNVVRVLERQGDGSWKLRVETWN